ncbi:MAG: RrF2 family transcriptional regulator [Candidatus Zixiibacteriota bacterium]
MKLTKKADYALRAVYYISRLSGGALASIGEVADKQSAPREFLAKILQQLTRANILRSYQGIKGGYQLARDPKTISFLDVIEAVEGPITLNQCCREGGECCEMYDECGMREFWNKLQAVYVQQLRSETMDRYDPAGGSSKGAPVRALAAAGASNS